MSNRIGYQTTSLIIVFFSLIAYISLVVFIYYNFIIYEPSQTMRLLLLGFFELIMIVPLYIYVRTNEHSFKHVCRFRRYPQKATLHILFVAVGLFFFVEILNTVTDLIVNTPNMENADYYCSSLANVFALVISSVLIAPFVEEAIFRGFLIRSLGNKGYSPATAIIISALAFSIAHLNVWESVTYFMAGCVLGYVAFYFRSIKPTILIHVIFNSLVVIDINFPQIRAILFYSNPILHWSIIILGNILLGLGLYQISKNIKPAKRVKIM